MGIIKRAYTLATSNFEIGRCLQEEAQKGDGPKMENPNCNRRGRRRRGCHQCGPLTLMAATREKSGFLNFIYNTMVMAMLVSVIYMMLDFHCTNCSDKCNSTAKNITKHIQEISDNIALMNMNYKDLQQKITYLSHELPRLEGQIETLEALAGGLGDMNCKIYKSPLCDPYCTSDCNTVPISAPPCEPYCNSDCNPVLKSYCYGFNEPRDKNCTVKHVSTLKKITK